MLFGGTARVQLTPTYNNMELTKLARPINAYSTPQESNVYGPFVQPSHPNCPSIPNNGGTQDVPRAWVAPVTAQQQSKQPGRQSHRMAELKQQYAGDQYLAPPAPPAPNSPGHLSPIDKFLSDREEYKPGLSPSRSRSRSRAAPVQPANNRGSNKASTTTNRFPCPSCPKVHKTRNALKYVNAALTNPIVVSSH